MKSKSYSQLYRTLAAILPICLGTLTPLSAQESTPPKEETKDKDKPTRIALVAIGDPPDPGFEIKGGRRHLKDADANEYPPTLLHVPGQKGKPTPVVMGLNLPSQQFIIKGTDTLRLMEAINTGEETTYKAWTSVKLPILNEDLSVFFYRSRPKASWRKSPKALVLSNSLTAFPAKRVRIINLSNREMIYQIDGKKPFALRPSKYKIIPTSNPEYCSYSVAFRDGKETVFIARNQAITVQADSRINLVAYSTDSSSPSDSIPVRLQSFYELPPQTPAKLPEGGEAESSDAAP